MHFNELPVNPNNSWNIKAAQVLWFILCALWSAIHSRALESLRNKADLWCYPLITAVWNKPNVGIQNARLSRGKPAAQNIRTLLLDTQYNWFCFAKPIILKIYISPFVSKMKVGYKNNSFKETVGVGVHLIQTVLYLLLY